MLIAALVNALVPASLYAMIGVSFVLVYRTTQVLNFAMGQFLLIGGLALWSLQHLFSGSLLPAVIALVVAGGAMGCALYLTLLRPLTGQGPLIMVMFTIILGGILQAAGGIIWGTASKTLDDPFTGGGVTIASGVTLTELDLVIVATAAIVLGAVAGLVRFTSWGIAMRATAEDPVLASFRGVNVVSVATIAWGLSTAVAFLCGAAIGMRGTVDVSVVAFGFVGFAAILIGGLDSIAGALVGAVVVALIQSFVATYIGGDWTEVSSYVVLLIALMIKPYGLFGTPEFRRV